MLTPHCYSRVYTPPLPAIPYLQEWEHMQLLESYLRRHGVQLAVLKKSDNPEEKNQAISRWVGVSMHCLVVLSAVPHNSTLHRAQRSACMPCRATPRMHHSLTLPSLPSLAACAATASRCRCCCCCCSFRRNVASVAPVSVLLMDSSGQVGLDLR